ncbi:MAG: 6-hydroxymethyl-7,8-dihydropterin pyrophosphokinase [Thermoplasmata archaeon]|nr:MAG: 6-hydroxymethyl-7,8-dihydropterin pyrophosphokinase [Thermoplasmata archaeon]
MLYNEWEPFYKKILKDFNFNIQKDIEAANVLNSLLKHKKLYPIDKLEKLIKNKTAFIFGAGPSLEPSIQKHKKKFKDELKISADGATTALLKNNIQPDIIVTDLDGKISDQITANSKDSIAIIHAHGDNIEKIKKLVPEFKGDLIGTTQNNPVFYENLYNFGGFTDGDRAVYLVEHFHVKKTYLIGFDFNNEIGEYSFSENKNVKQKIKKLKWCKYLIGSLKMNNKNIYFI